VAWQHKSCWKTSVFDNNYQSINKVNFSFCSLHVCFLFNSAYVMFFIMFHITRCVISFVLVRCSGRASLLLGGGVMTCIFFRCDHKSFPRFLYDYTHALVFFFSSLAVSHASWIFPFLSYICDGLFLSF
jgi:hypothetical protein